jgi:hypothetical protein
MDAMALKCRSMAALAMPSQVGRHAVVQRTGGAALKFSLSLARCNAISAGAHCSGRPSEVRFLRVLSFFPLFRDLHSTTACSFLPMT